MKTYPADKKITIGFFGHNSTGKTSLAEAMFFNTGTINRMGKISDGNTVLDFEVEEKNRHQSINLGIGYVEYNDIKIQILDAPGFLDFQGEIISGLYATDIAALFVNPGSAIEVGFERAIELIEEKEIPLFFIINGIDKENSEFKKSFEDINSYSSLGIAPITLPMGEKSNFKGIINLLDMKAYLYKDTSGKAEITDIPDEYKDTAEKFREKILSSSQGKSFIAKDKKAALLLITLKPGIAVTEKADELIERMLVIIHQNEGPEKVYLAGDLYVTYYAKNAMGRDLYFLFALIVLVIIGFILLAI